MDEGTILEDSMNLFGEKEKDDSVIKYGSISISLPAKVFDNPFIEPESDSSELVLEQEGKVPCSTHASHHVISETIRSRHAFYSQTSCFPRLSLWRNSLSEAM